MTGIEGVRREKYRLEELLCPSEEPYKFLPFGPNEG